MRHTQAQRGLADDAFKTECRGWDVSEALFADAGLWAQYVALLRADFSLFDEYVFRRAGEAPFAFPLLAFHASSDRKVSPALVACWAAVTTGAFSSKAIAGHHLFVMGVGEQRAAKEAWLSAIVADLRGLL
jgi:surfactin synthase thioesterase subunit